MHNEVVLLTAILALGIFCQWLAWRLRMPAILPLLAAGLAVGPLLNLVEPTELMGDLFFPIISLAVAIILFEGALTLRWSEVVNVVATVRNLVTVGAAITWVIGAVSAHFLFGLDWQLAILFGSLIVVTGPTVIAPLLRNVRPTQKVASVLKWEGILIDPLGALLAVLVFDLIVSEGPSATLGLQAVTGFLEIILIATGSGVIGGLFVAFLLRRYMVPDYLRDVVVLAIVATVFAVSDYLSSESGLLAVTLMGILLANLDLPQLHNVLNFKEKLSVILISFLFIDLGANITRAQILSLVNVQSLALLAIVMLVARPLAIAVSSKGSQLSRNERLYLSWIAPRGIVAAAVSSLFAFRLAELGYEDAPLLTALTFLIIVGTVLIQGGTAKTVARLLKVAEAEPQGFLIMGAHPFARRVALALADEDFTVRLVDTNWQNVTAARQEGLDVFHGDILSEVTDDDLDLSGVGRLMALTSNYEANALACAHMQPYFGSSGVFQLPPTARSVNGRGAPSRERLGRLLFHAEATFENLEDMLERGAIIKRTQITEAFSYQAYRSKHGGKFVPLMQVRSKEVKVVTVEAFEEPQPGWTLVSLVAPPQDFESNLVRSSADVPKEASILAQASGRAT